MAQTLRKSTDYKERSKIFAKKHSLPTIEEVKEHLKEEALSAAKRVTSLINAKGNPNVLRLQLDAAKAVLKYNGLETESVVHSGKVEFEPTKIFRGEA